MADSFNVGETYVTTFYERLAAFRSYLVALSGETSGADTAIDAALTSFIDFTDLLRAQADRVIEDETKPISVLAPLLAHLRKIEILADQLFSRGHALALPRSLRTAGGKGMPESVAVHPCVFATFTAPSFGPVHTRVTTAGGTVARCRPRRKASFCEHCQRISCSQRHKEDDTSLGRPLCPDCYDYHAAVVWNAHSGELWRRTVITLRRSLDKLARQHGTRVRLSYAKVAEFQRRGLIHFHAIFRLDGDDPAHPERTIQPHPAITADVLAGLIRQVAAAAWFATIAHPARPGGWDIRWGAQVDPRVVRLTGDGQVTDVAVASYLAKYATKSTELAGMPPGRISAGNVAAYADKRTHQGRLISACLKIGAHPHEDYQALRRWAHMLGYRGHFATKSRRYSTTMRALRAARRDWQRRQHPHQQHEPGTPVLTITDLAWAGRGWRTSGDALLALSAAARAREHRRIAREEMAFTS